MNNVKSIIQSHKNFILSKYNEMTAQINKNSNKHNIISKNDKNNYSDNTHVINISFDRNDNSCKNNKVNTNNNDNIDLINKKN